LNVTFAEREGVAILHLAGMIAVGPDVKALRDTIDATLEGGWRRVVVDLEALTFVDSAALGEFVASRRRVREAGGRLVLTSPRGKVRDVVELTRLDQLLDFKPTVDEAVASLSGG
jgi:anti-anti-sigma factor